MTSLAARALSGLSFADADALVFDPIDANRSATRMALSTLGFVRIATTAVVDDLPRLLADRMFDLLVADITQDTAKACGIVRAVRDAQAGKNPFLHIVLMAWRLEGDLVRRALNCGADDLITRPYSVDFLAARIRAHTEARKPFIVTSEYIGPDRRRAPPRESSDVFDVPNMLLAKAGEGPGSDAAEQIGAANARLTAERARKCAFKIAVMLQQLRESDRTGRSLQSGLEQLEVAAKDLQNRVEGAEKEAVDAIVTPLLANLARVRSGDTVGANLNEMDHNAKALLEILYPGRDKDEILQEIVAAIANAKARELKRQKIA